MTRMLAVLLLCATSVAAAERVQPGEWETTMTMGSTPPTLPQPDASNMPTPAEK